MLKLIRCFSRIEHMLNFSMWVICLVNWARKRTTDMYWGTDKFARGQNPSGGTNVLSFVKVQKFVIMDNQ